VTAQPALSKLFDGFVSLLKQLQINGSIPIVSSRTFNWTEALLPFDAVKTMTVSPGTPYPQPPPSFTFSPFLLGQYVADVSNIHVGFSMNNDARCVDTCNGATCCQVELRQTGAIEPPSLPPSLYLCLLAPPPPLLFPSFSFSALPRRMDLRSLPSSTCRYLQGAH